MRVNDLFFGVILVALGAGAAAAAQAFPPVPGQPFGAAVFPTIVGAALVLCGLALCVSGARDWVGRPRFFAPPWARKPETMAVVWTIAGLLFCALFVERLEFALCIFVLMFPLQRLLGARSGVALAVCAATAMVIELGFVWLLGSPLPRGVVEALFR